MYLSIGLGQVFEHTQLVMLHSELVYGNVHRDSILAAPAGGAIVVCREGSTGEHAFERGVTHCIDFEEISSYPGLHTDPAAGVIAYARVINPLAEIGDNVSFGTEAGLFDGIGVECLVCGPGSIEQAHKPDEFVSREQLQHCDRMLENLARRCRETAEFD